MKKNNKEINIFSFLNQIQNKQKKIPYDRKVASAWMLSMWLSMDKSLIKKVNNINKYLYLLPDEVVYEYFMDIIPTGKRYIKFTKKREEDKKLKNRIKKIQEIYPELSKRECMMIISSLKNVRRNK